MSSNEQTISLALPLAVLISSFKNVMHKHNSKKCFIHLCLYLNRLCVYFVWSNEFFSLFSRFLFVDCSKILWKYKISHLSLCTQHTNTLATAWCGHRLNLLYNGILWQIEREQNCVLGLPNISEIVFKSSKLSVFFLLYKSDSVAICSKIHLNCSFALHNIAHRSGNATFILGQFDRE